MWDTGLGTGPLTIWTLYWTLTWFVIHLPYNEITACADFSCAHLNTNRIIEVTEERSLCSKQDSVESVLPSSYTGAGEPTNLQCHSSAATATARWTVRCFVFLLMYALRQLRGFLSSCTIYYSEAKSNYIYLLHWLILHSWAAMCQQGWVWQSGYTDGCRDSCCSEWAQHLAKCHHPHSQEVPAG